VIRNDKR